MCQFPVKVSGVLHWQCQDRKGVKVCNTNDDIQIFNNTESFKPCGKCKPDCIRTQQIYSGFPLNNKNNRNRYEKVESADDCQKICQATKGCNFFNFGQNQCWLKYGIGKKDAKNGFFFGPKFCPGKQQSRCSQGLSTNSFIHYVFLTDPV